MPDAFASNRGSRLNCRFAVNGIQYASSEVSLAAARAGSFASRAAGSRSLYKVVSLDAWEGDRPAVGAFPRLIEVGAVRMLSAPLRPSGLSQSGFLFSHRAMKACCSA